MEQLFKFKELGVIIFMKQWAEIGALKLSLYLKDKVTSEFYEKYSSILLEQTTKEMLLQKISEQKEQKSIYLQELFDLCSENIIAITWVELAFLEYLMPFSNMIFDYITCHHTSGVTMELATKIALNSPDISQATSKMIQAYQMIQKILIEDTTQEDILYRSFRADLSLILFIEGKEFNSFEETMYTYFSKKEKLLPSILYQEEIENFTKKIKQFLVSETPVLWITGEKASGKKFMTKHLAVCLGWNLFFLKGEEIVALGLVEQKKMLSRLFRDAVLFRACICLCDIQKFADTSETLENLCETFLKKLPDRPLIITSYLTFELPQRLYSKAFEMRLSPCTASQRLKLWNEFAALYLNKNSFPFPKAADRFHLTAGQIKSVIERIKRQNIEEYDMEEVMKFCYQVLGQTNKMVHSNTYPYTFKDLKVPVETKRLLEAVCDQVNYKRKLLEDWGLKRFYAYGTCVSVLMQGMSGTGKTMAAHVIANTLNMELFKIDLSQIMDKYIGETEKRLEQSFDLAEKTSKILFFDEADVLFGRRSDIHDSKDRYANNEVSYILQRLEEFDGVVLLTTNLQNNIDAAFIRRMRYIIPFPMPDASCRKEIWKSLFQGNIPYKEIDFDFLAERFELSGATIKNVVFNAAVLAAREEYLTMKHIIQSLAEEYRKVGKLVIREEFLEYSKYL